MFITEDDFRCTPHPTSPTKGWPELKYHFEGEISSTSSTGFDNIPMLFCIMAIPCYFILS